jgi:IPT/TIG domain/Regulator of chromosome condensation (RCC1) repeat
MYAWGANTDGQLGDGTFTGPEKCEAQIPCAASPVPVSPLGGVIGIASGLADSYAVVSEPAVTSISPPVGDEAGGTAVTITGLSLTGATSVKFSSVEATSFTVNSETSITAVAPAGIGTVDVTVTTPGGTSVTNAGDKFRYAPEPPRVERVSPSEGRAAGGTPVTITGANFSGASEVMFGKTRANSFTVNSESSISAVSPPGSGTVDVTVTTADGTSPSTSHDQFTYVSEGTGTVKGTVTDEGAAHNAVEHALVSVCSRSGAETCYSAETASDGFYSITEVAEGEFVTSVSPPEGSGDDPAISTPFLLTRGATATENFNLTRPTPPPPGTVVSGFGETTIGGDEVPVIDWSVETPITTRACAGGTVNAAVSAENIRTGAQETVGPVTLTESLSEFGSFTGKLPIVYPLHGVGTVTITVAGCQMLSEDQTVAFTIYIDPSGTVVDANDGNAPLGGATVTLLSSTNLTGPFTPVANGSAVMSPANRVNPDSSRTNGGFGWDTVAGFYEIRASKPGCGTITIHPFQVPPEISNIQIPLHCALGFHVEINTLPTAKRSAPYTAQLEAYGGAPSYKWKKTAKLPQGLKLSKTGVLSGTPSKKATPGSYAVAVQVQDASKEKVTATLALELT